MERMTMKTALDNLMCNYGKKYGVSRETFFNMLKSGIDEYGFSVRAAYIGVKMMLAEQTGEHEYFTSEDIAEITGETVEEVNARIEELGTELQAQGINPDTLFTRYEPIRMITKL